MLKFKKSLILAGLSAVLTTSVFAATQNSFYVKADAGYTVNNFKIEKNEDKNISSSRGKLTYGLGLGYQFDNNFRTDVTLYRTNLEKTSVIDLAPSVDVKAKKHSNLILANVYYDFVSMNDSIVPYISAGIGFGNVDGNKIILAKTSSDTSAYANKNIENRGIRFAYALGIGASYTLTEQLVLDTSYKFSQILKAQENTDSLNNNQFLVGFRFSF